MTTTTTTGRDDCTVLVPAYANEHARVDCLPRTGTDIAPIAILGLVVLVAGLALWHLTRGDRRA